ncbi:MAG: hypothetical protein JJU37_00035 [Balneolaceae bacterium]|nr:hypothetical protein [Balneolaceae bacterium]
MPTALTRAISPLLGECELTHLHRAEIDIKKAQKQHGDYEKALEKMGYTIRRVADAPHLPDGVFIEDTAVVFPELSIITRPGAESRRPETESVAVVLSKYRNLKTITYPGTLDGGDVLTLGNQVFIGISKRTNSEAIQQFSDFLKPYGYSVKGVPVTKCLHLKTAIAVIEDDLLLINPEWIDESLFPSHQYDFVHTTEPYGANVICKDNLALCPKAFPKTADWLRKKGYDVILIDQSEMAKAEAGLTCSSILID